GGLSVVLNSQTDIVRSFVTWAGVSNPDRFSSRQKEEWRKEGVFNVLNARTNQLMSMSVNFLNDLEENLGGRLNIKNVLSKNIKPYLIIQGEQDLAVKVREAENLYGWTKENAQLEILPGTGHTFDAVHPFKEESENLKKVLNKTIKFIEEII
ncbi:MAG: alpha/beta hydrolase family protein, partial [Rhodothermaceae bacterium]